VIIEQSKEHGGLIGIKSMEVDPTHVVKVDGDTGDIRLLVSTEAIDSDGDVVHQGKTKHGAGWVVKRFNGAPVITWSHDMRIPNLSGPRTKAKVGAIVGTEATGRRGLHLDPLQFDEGDLFAMELDGKMRRDVLKESSVGFLIREYQPRVVEGKRVGMDIYEQELVETAIVNRGANPETATLAKSMLVRLGHTVEDAGDHEVKELTGELDNLKGLVSVLADELKRLGDKVDADAESEAEKLLGAKVTERNEAAKELLGALRRVGVAQG